MTGTNLCTDGLKTVPPCSVMDPILHLSREPLISQDLREQAILHSPLDADTRQVLLIDGGFGDAFQVQLIFLP